jgi:hypothetical protein
MIWDISGPPSLGCRFSLPWKRENVKKFLPAASLHSFWKAGKTTSSKGGEDMKEEEKKPITWEAADPKLPVVQSGHLEDRKRN